jgi:hypothetical protein
VAQGAQVPPQSTSVSVPFLTPSEQVGAWHVPEHTRLVQSLATLQGCPVGHRAGHVVPPQSMPVSSWFAIPSLHDAG